MKYKLLALDLDGTLLMPDKTIPEDVKKSITELQEKGIIVTLCTGRMYPTVKKYAEELGITYPLVCYNGALIRSADDDEPVMYEPLDMSLQEKIIACGEENGWYLQLYQDDRVAAAEITYETLADPDAKTLPPVALGKLSEAVLSPSPKMMSFCDPSEVPVRIGAFERATDGKLYIASSTPNLVEMMKKGVCKSEALKKLCEIYGIRREEVVVCGDSGNDADMIRWAALGCAMANATEELKAVSDYICENSYSYGVKEVIERFF
ncbi:MAG: HAD family phosphatase [Anaerofustis stercorihominis]|nr:HAD family phosphatase [Anaerofustis stercorihominis]